jgi:DNA modification methylase
MLPIALADLCLRLAAPKPDELVLDPFAGIGNTSLAAKALGLTAIGIDIDPNYCAAAREQLSVRSFDSTAQKRRWWTVAPQPK